jgi:hypothetical protein
VAGQRPAANPAAVVLVVDTDHLIQVIVAGEGDAVTLVERHGVRSGRKFRRSCVEVPVQRPAFVIRRALVLVVSVLVVQDSMEVFRVECSDR